MDSQISGLSKLVFTALNDSDNGKEVTVSNGINTWKVAVANKKAELLVPSLPVPARKDFIIEFNGFRRTVNVGYGQIVKITLAAGYEPVVGAELLSLSDIASSDSAAIANKGPSAMAVKELSMAVTEALVADNGTSFKFGIDSQGRYGYIKAGADSVTPFKDGSESYCFLLGEGTSFDVKAKCDQIKASTGIDIDYKTLTADNFICQPIPNSKSTAGRWTSSTTGQHVADSAYAVSEYDAPKIAYNAEKGTVTISGSEHRGRINLNGIYATGVAFSKITVKVYLVNSIQA